MLEISFSATGSELMPCVPRREWIVTEAILVSNFSVATVNYQFGTLSLSGSLTAFYGICLGPVMG
jgi:hypothetical protein